MIDKKIFNLVFLYGKIYSLKNIQKLYVRLADRYLSFWWNFVHVMRKMYLNETP